MQIIHEKSDLPDSYCDICRGESSTLVCDECDTWSRILEHVAAIHKLRAA